MKWVKKGWDKQVGAPFSKEFVLYIEVPFKKESTVRLGIF